MWRKQNVLPKVKIQNSRPWAKAIIAKSIWCLYQSTGVSLHIKKKQTEYYQRQQPIKLYYIIEIMQRLVRQRARGVNTKFRLANTSLLQVY